MPYRVLGKTGEKVSVIGLGGAHIGYQSEEAESIRIIRTALDTGMNFLDNCWDYNGGQSEIRMGKALRDGYRQKAFLMTKIDGRDRKTAAAQIDESLRRLQTDHLDLLQVHEIIRLSDPDHVFSENGAGVRAVLVGGRTVFTDGRVTNVDESSLRIEAQDAAARLDRACAPALDLARAAHPAIAAFCCP